MEKELHVILEPFNNVIIITDADFDMLNDLKISQLQIEKNTLIVLEQWIIYALEQYQCNNSVTLSAAEPFYLKQVYTHK